MTEDTWRVKAVSGMLVNAWATVTGPLPWYARLLHGRATVDIWRTTYFHRLAGPAGIVEWLTGTGLRPFIGPLAADDQTAFLERYQAAVAEAYPAQPDGTVLLPFPRLFIVATC